MPQNQNLKGRILLEYYLVTVMLDFIFMILFDYMVIALFYKRQVYSNVYESVHFNIPINFRLYN